MRGIGKYEVIGVDGDFILAKCLVCNNQNHPCIVKLNKIDGYKTRWKYVSMMQNCGSDTYEDSDGCEVNNEYIWHNDSPFFERKGDCKKFKGAEIITKYKDELSKLEKQVENKKAKIKELELWMNDEEAEK